MGDGEACGEVLSGGFLGGDAAHAASLERLASSLLLEGRPHAAFRYADRRCRLPIVSEARHHLLRSTALLHMGDTAASADALEEAARLDWADPFVTRAVLGRGSDDDTRARAALDLLRNPRASDDDAREALAFLRARGERIVLVAARTGERVSGWVAWSEGETARLSIRSERRVASMAIEPDRDDPLAAMFGNAGRFSIDQPASSAITLRASAGAGQTPPFSVYADLPPSGFSRPDHAFPKRGTARAGGPSRINVIVPVYGDLDATKACLDALGAQSAPSPVHILVVDDASPDADLADFAQGFCRTHDAHLIVNRVNHGFAGSVNRALLLCEEGDILLLNSDAILPIGALDRFVAAAYGAEDIGTVLPMSNDSEYTSFPKPNVPNPLPDPARRSAIDAAAFSANGNGTVDLVNGIGFCLYVKRACFDAVGPLSQVYDRGYYEDVEFCLRAEELGYRNVAATGLYVAHASGRSFRSEKRGLVSRNIAVLETRFPEHRRRCATFLKADPLRAARAAIERILPPEGPVALLVGRPLRLGPVLARRARDLAGEGFTVLNLSWTAGPAHPTLTVAAMDGKVPQSLAFHLDSEGSVDVARYLAALDVARVELAEPEAVPRDLLRPVLALGVRPNLLVADFDSFEAVNGSVRKDGAAPERWTVIPADRMVQAAWARSSPVEGQGSSPQVGRIRRPSRPSEGGATHGLGVLIPRPSPRVDRLLLGLARGLRTEDGMKLVVFGACVDDIQLMATGRMFVTGSIPDAHYAQAIIQYGVDGLFLPFRTSFFGFLDDLAEETGLPRAYFDWSAGALPRHPDDLALERGLPDEEVAPALRAWCLARAGGASRVWP